MDLNDALKFLADFVRHLDLGHERTFDVLKDSTVLINRGEYTIILVGNDADKYTDLVTSIYEAISNRERPVSKRAVRGLVGDFFLRVLESRDATHTRDFTEKLQSELRALKSALFEKPRNWEIFLPVEGLAPSGLPLTVGQVQFRFLDMDSFQAVKNRIVDTIAQSNSANKDAVVTKICGDADSLREKAVGVLSVSAVDDEAAILAAKHQLQITVDAINFFASPDQMGGWVFLPGDGMPQRELTLAFCEDGRFIPSFRQAGPLRKIPLNQIARRKGFARVSEILSKENLSGAGRTDTGISAMGRACSSGS